MINITDTDQERIQNAVADAERRTSGEIVAYMVAQSDYYGVAIWRAAVLFALLGLAVGFVALRFQTGWTSYAWLDSASGMVLFMMGWSAVGAALTALSPWLKRAFTGRERLRRSVHLQAMRAFVEEEVHMTRNRTGILLFVSLFEHRIEVLADEGINKVVAPDEWIDVVERIRNGIKHGRFTDGLVDAIGMCGHLLKNRGLAVEADDTDELGDRLRIRKKI